MDDDERRVNLLADADTLVKGFVDQLWNADDTATLNEIGARLMACCKLLIPPPPQSQYVVSVVSNARIAGRKAVHDWLELQNIPKEEVATERLCKDCRWATTGMTNISRPHCMHATATVAAKIDLVNGGLTESFQISCESSRIGMMPDRCSQVGRFWERKD